jgi:hypothetical protein
LLLFLFSFSYHSFRLAALFLFSLLLIYPLHLPSLCLILSYFILFCFIHFHAISVRSILTAPFPSCLRSVFTVGGGYLRHTLGYTPG